MARHSSGNKSVPFYRTSDEHKELLMEPNMKDLKFKDEVQKMEYEPLDATELALVRWSLGIGITLLVALFVVSKWVIPGAHG